MRPDVATFLLILIVDLPVPYVFWSGANSKAFGAPTRRQVHEHLLPWKTGCSIPRALLPLQLIVHSINQRTICSFHFNLYTFYFNKLLVARAQRRGYTVTPTPGVHLVTRSLTNGRTAAGSPAALAPVVLPLSRRHTICGWRFVSADQHGY